MMLSLIIVAVNFIVDLLYLYSTRKCGLVKRKM